MNIFLGVQEGMREIWAHKFRSFLTMLGIIMGVGSLLSMFALTEGMARGFRDTLQQVGGIERIEIQESPVPPEQEMKAELSPGRTYADARALRTSAPLIAYVSPEVTLQNAKMTHLNKSSNPRLAGVQQDYLVVDRHHVEYGRFISDLDLERCHRVCVLGRNVVDELWEEPGAIPLGQIVRINGENFEVVGVFERYSEEKEKKAKSLGMTKKQDDRRKERGTKAGRYSMFWWKNSVAVIPLTTMLKVFKSSKVENNVDIGPDFKLSRLAVQVKDPNTLEAAIQQVRNVLMMTHRGIRDFGFETREDWMENIENSVRAARMSGGIIAGISLLVGGLGIANIMLASISERIREIGIRRAVGARGSDIFMQILMESTVLALVGGLIGVMAGFALVKLLIVLSPVDNNPVVEWTAVVISLFFAVLVGVLAGLYPAWKASQLSPIQALRYD